MNSENLIGTSLSKDISITEFHEDLISFSRDTIQMLYLALMKNPLTNYRMISKIQSVLRCLQIHLQ